MTTKKAPAASARATIRPASVTDAEKVSTTRTVSQAMKQSPNWAAATNVQASVTVWNTNADALAANALVISNLRAQLKTAEATQGTLRRDWRLSRVGVATSVTTFAAGSVDVVQGFNLDVVSHNRLGLLEAPLDLSVGPGKQPGQVLVKWTKGIAVHGFLVQHATDPTTPATISSPVASTKPKLVLSGMPLGSSLSCRVAAIDPASPTGQSPWTVWIVGSAR